MSGPFFHRHVSFLDRCDTLEILLINDVVNFVSDFFVVPFAVSTACDVTRSLHHQTIVCRQFFFATRSNCVCEDKEVTESSQMLHHVKKEFCECVSLLLFHFSSGTLVLLFHLCNFPLLRKYTSISRT